MTRKPAAEPLYPRAVRLSQADQLRLERLASAMGCSGSEAIRRAVREALERRLCEHTGQTWSDAAGVWVDP